MAWRLLRRGGALCAVLCGLAAPAWAQATAAPCSAAAGSAEQAQSLPARLLLAIGRVESGRADPLTREVAPWPWTVNAQGAGHFFSTRDEAIAFVRSLQATGVRSIDVGCFQVNLLYHPGAFSSLEDAFDPESNARYAARFLSSLRDRSGAWEAAVGLYHSANPIEGEPYRRRVLALLSGAPLPAGAAPAPFALLAHRDDPVAVLMSAAARAVVVVTPRGTPAVVTAARAPAGPVATRAPTAVVMAGARRRLPQVFTPSIAG